jgi:hypothetical protein
MLGGVGKLVGEFSSFSGFGVMDVGLTLRFDIGVCLTEREVVMKR